MQYKTVQKLITAIYRERQNSNGHPLYPLSPERFIADHPDIRRPSGVARIPFPLFIIQAGLGFKEGKSDDWIKSGAWSVAVVENEIVRSLRAETERTPKLASPSIHAWPYRGDTPVTFYLLTVRRMSGNCFEAACALGCSLSSAVVTESFTRTKNSRVPLCPVFFSFFLSLFFLYFFSFA